MRHLVLVALVLPGAALRAQNDVVLAPENVRLTSRGDVDVNAGEILQGFHKSHWRGLGDTGARCEITALIARSFQDEDRSTAESYSWVLRAGSDAAGPTAGSAGEIAVVGPLKLGPAVGTGPIAYEVTDTLATPIVVPCDDFFAIGARLPAVAVWPADGQSAWIGANLGTPPFDDNALGPQALDQAWQILGSTVSHPGGKRCWRLGFQVKHDALQAGNEFGLPRAANFGSGGLFPDVAKGQGLAFRVHATGKNGQLVVVLPGLGFAPTGLPAFPGPRVWLDLATVLPLIFGPATIANDAATFTAVPVLPPGLTGTVVWQALVIDLARVTVSLSNAVATSF